MINLLNIAFEVTTECNLKCAYCYNHWKCNDDYPRLNSYKKALKTLKRLFKIAEIQQITFTGGEPFLSERFIELILFCRLEGKTISVITNGNTGNFEDYKTLISLGATLFQIPVLSSQKEEHDILTGINGSWVKATNSIIEILKLGGNVVPVIVLTRLNNRTIAETLLFLNNLGLKRIMLNRYNIGGIGKLRDDLPLNKSEIAEAFNSSNDLAGKLGLKITSNVCSPLCYINPNQFPFITFGNCSPDATRRPITVNIEGDVRLCNHSPIVAGNIYKNNFEEIFSSNYSKLWSETKPKYCEGCSLFIKCLGGCRAASEQLGLSLSHPDPIISRAM